MVKSSGITIMLVSRKEEANEVARLAPATGSEEHEIEEMLKNDTIFIAKRRGKTIGFIALKRAKEENAIEISGLGTNQHERRKGVARLLTDHAEKHSRNINASKLIVKTSNDNIPALALYQLEGFRIVSVRLGALVEHHAGKEIIGWHGIPARDELTLEKAL